MNNLLDWLRNFTRVWGVKFSQNMLCYCVIKEFPDLLTLRASNRNGLPLPSLASSRDPFALLDCGGKSAFLDEKDLKHIPETQIHENTNLHRSTPYLRLYMSSLNSPSKGHIL